MSFNRKRTHHRFSNVGSNVLGVVNTYVVMIESHWPPNRVKIVGLVGHSSFLEKMKRTKRFEIKPLGINIIQLRWDCLNRLFWSLKFNTFSIFRPPMNYRWKCTVPLKNGEALLRTFCRTFSKTYSEVQFTVIFSTFEKIDKFLWFFQKLYNFQFFTD